MAMKMSAALDMRNSVGFFDLLTFLRLNLARQTFYDFLKFFFTKIRFEEE